MGAFTGLEILFVVLRGVEAFLDKVVGALTDPEDAVLAEVVLTDSVRANLEEVMGFTPEVFVTADFGAALYGSFAFSSSLSTKVLKAFISI